MIIQKTREQERMAHLSAQAKRFAQNPPVSGQLNWSDGHQQPDRYDPETDTTLLEDVVMGVATVVCIAAIGGACVVLQLARRVWP